ncbi:MAG: hypothetical protein EOP54_16535, partial [Sphingobacteriales bacterium]
LTPTAADEGASIEINGQPVPSGTGWTSQDLSVGYNTANIWVTAADGSEKYYGVNIYRNGESDAFLTNLQLSAGSISFNSNNFDYYVTVGNDVETIDITPTVADPGSVVTINGTTVTSGSPLTNQPLTLGENYFDIRVTAPDGETIFYYSLNVFRGVEPPALEFYGGFQTFYKNEEIYPFGPSASGVAAPAYRATQDTVGTINALALTLVKDLQGNMYSSSPNDSTIYKIPVGGGPAVVLTKFFNSPYGMVADAAGNLFVADQGLTNIYKIAAGTNTPVAIGPALSDPYALAIDATGNLYVTSNPSGKITRLLVSDNYATKEILAEEGFANAIGMALDAENNIYTTEISTGKFKKFLAGDGYANAITIDSLLQFPVGVQVDAAGNVFVAEAFASVVRKYPANGDETIFINAQFGLPTGLLLNNDGSFYAVNGGFGTIGKVIPAGGFYLDKPLPKGLIFDEYYGEISGTPTATSPATYYTITGYNESGKASASVGFNVLGGNADLDYLDISQEYLTPYFTPDRINYSAGVDADVTTINLTPVLSDPAATVKINGVEVESGSPSQEISLNTGNNVIPVVVTSANGEETKTYTVTVNRGRVEPTIAYSGSTSKTYYVGDAITPLNLVANNVNPPAYSCIPEEVAPMTGPIAVASDAAGNLYVADIADSSIYKIPVGTGTPQLFKDGFTSPTGIALDAAGNVYVADIEEGTVSKIPASGGTPVVIGSGFEEVYGVAVDATGNVYVTEPGANKVKRINVSGGTVDDIGSGFNIPLGIALDAERNIYVTNLDGTVKKLTAISNYTTDETIVGGLDYPVGIAVDAANNIYVTESASGRVKKIENGTYAVSNISECFIEPAGISVDGKGNVYVADPGFDGMYGGVSIINPTGGFYISPVLPAGMVFNDATGTISGTPKEPSAAKTYTITAYNPYGNSTATVNITVLPANANLSKLLVIGGNLSPVFGPDKISYTSYFNSGIEASVQFKPTASDPNATIKVNGQPVVSGAASQSIPLNVGPNTIPVVVTSANGASTKTYTVVVGSGAHEAGLKSVTFSPSSK